MSANQYQKHFIPLESNPDVFTQLTHELGVSPTLRFQDVLTLDEPALFPRPALALILIFPTSETYETQISKEEATDEEDVVWFKQTINNACGLYAIEPGSLLANLIETLNPCERALTLENSVELQTMYAMAATGGDTLAPTNAEDEVDFHFVCFVKSNKNSRIYELDGDRAGPIDKGIILASGDDMLAAGGLSIVKEYIQREGSGGSGFSLMALVSTS